MNLAKKLWMTTGDSSGGLAPSSGYVDDVFSTYVYKGNGANRSFVTGQNLLADGGMVWTKGRSGSYGATDHYLFDTIRGADIFVSSNTVNGQGAFGAGTSVGFNSSGITLGTSPYVNDAATEYVAWTFRNASRFFQARSKTHTGGTASTLSLAVLGTVGMVLVKRIDASSGWLAWHRGMTAGNLLALQGNNEQYADASISISGTTLTLAASLPSGSYIVYAWAHDTALDGIVQCGSFTTDSSGNATVTLGWEPQFLIDKASSAVTHWVMRDSMRGFNVTTSSALQANLSNAENAPSYNVSPTSTGFKFTSAPGIQTYIYLAIRRPNKPPTSGTQVYNASTASGVVSAGFPVDLHIGATRAGAANNHAVHSRLVGGAKELATSSTATEATTADIGFDSMTGLRASLSAGGVNHFFRRAPGFFDVVCYTGDNQNFRTVPHGLGVRPQFAIVKKRNDVSAWVTSYATGTDLDPERLELNSSAAVSAGGGCIRLGSSSLTSASVFWPDTPVNASGYTYITLLFATIPGISKVGRYSGNGGTQTIPCGFTTGSRFILIKRIDNTGDWFVWDTARGITPTTDPHLSLNTAAAEVTTDDSIDQDASGFVVNQNAATNINALGGNYLFLAIA